MDSVALVLNSTPSYYWILPGTVALIQRYAHGNLPLFIGTEVPDHPVMKYLCTVPNVHIVPLDTQDADFFESRLATLKALPDTIQIVLPLQDDFLLERPGPDWMALKEAVESLSSPSVASVRLMPCPGSTLQSPDSAQWVPLADTDLRFSYQATLWRRDVYERFLHGIIRYIRSTIPDLEPGTREYNLYAVNANPAETAPGHSLLRALCPESTFLCWKRIGPWANAVYLSPWPYRPTAIVKGILQPFAKELLEREGIWSLCQRYR